MSDRNRLETMHTFKSPMSADRRPRNLFVTTSPTNKMADRSPPRRKKSCNEASNRVAKQCRGGHAHSVEHSNDVRGETVGAQKPGVVALKLG